MPLLRLTNGFDKMSDANLVVRSQNIIAAMTGNANFPTPDPTLAVMQTALNAYSDALDAAKTGDKTDIAIKNQKKADLVDQIHLLGAYVLYTSKQDSAIAISSGFTVAKDPSPAPDITKPENFQVDNGLNSGELQVSCNAVPGARSYMYQYTSDAAVTDATQWETETGTVRKNLFYGLNSGTRYWCRVAAVGINGQVVYSEPVARIAQ